VGGEVAISPPSKAQVLARTGLALMSEFANWSILLGELATRAPEEGSP